MIVIVGGGISGLALAHHLAARDRPFLLLEATDRVGGVIRSGRVAGHLLEWGPQRARLTRELSELVDDLGLRDRLLTAPANLPLYIYREHRLRPVPFSVGAFFTSKLLSWSGKLRVLREPFTAAPRDDESVADFFTRKLGREIYEHLIGPLYGGLYASDPRDMLVGLSLRHVLREFGIGRSLLMPLLRRGGRIEPPAACTFREGLEELPRALCERHRAHVRLNSPVRTITRSGSGYVVGTDDARIDAEHVVVSAPAGAAASMVAAVAPQAAARIAQLRYNPLAVVHVIAATKLRGLGYQVSFAESMVTRGVTFNDSLFQRRGVYTIYLGGARNAWVADEADDALARIAVDEFRAATGYDARALSVTREFMPAWDRSWSALTDLSFPPGLHMHTNWEARPGIPGRLAAARKLADKLAPA